MTETQIPILAKSRFKPSKVPKVLPNKYVKDSRTFIQYSPTLLRLAKQAYEARDIRKPTISSLGRSSLLKIANMMLLIEQNERNREEDKKRRELQAITGPSKIKYPTPLSQYMRL
jgi:hypothetical protein